MTSQFEGEINLKEKRTKTSISANFQSFDNYLYFKSRRVFSQLLLNDKRFKVCWRKDLAFQAWEF